MISTFPGDEFSVYTSTDLPGADEIRFRLSNGKILNIKNTEIEKGETTIIGDFYFEVTGIGVTDITFYAVDSAGEELGDIETITVSSDVETDNIGVFVTAIFVIASIAFLIYLLQISEKRYFPK